MEILRSLTRPSSGVWAIAVLAGGLASDLLLTCGANLVAFAVVAALTLPLRFALAISAGVWLESQIVGFGVLHYPRDAMTLGWGLALGTAALAAAVVAAGARRAARALGRVPGGVASALAAFAAYEIVLAGFALATHAGLGAFAPGIVVQIAALDAVAAIVALALYPVAGAVEAAIGRIAHARRGV